MSNDRHSDELVDGARIRHIALELTEACNYKCVMCDYWRIVNPVFMPFATAEKFISIFPPGQLQSILISGGEPLIHPHWREIAALLPREARRSICTNGSPLFKVREDIGRYFDRITVSVDGATDETFKAIRGYGHLTKILDNLSNLKARYPDIIIYLKMTIQRRNFREVISLLDLAITSGFVAGLGFGIPDFSGLAFGFDKAGFKADSYFNQMALTSSEIEEFEQIVEEIETKYHSELSEGFVYEGNLRRYAARFTFLRGLGPPPAGRHCIIPKQSAVLKADGKILGCYFLKSCSQIDQLTRDGLAAFEAEASLHSSLKNQTCASCDQLMFRNSPFELSPVKVQEH